MPLHTPASEQALTHATSADLNTFFIHSNGLDSASELEPAPGTAHQVVAHIWAQGHVSFARVCTMWRSMLVV